jgi:Ala-tRNA(Pro) deacylase
MTTTVFETLSERLTAAGIAFDVLRHAPVFTSQEAADVRGTSLSSGAKALVCKADERFVMFVLPADRKLASTQARAQAGIKSLRFANREEVEQLTALTPGSIPPFGSLFNLPTYCDRRLADETRINFNAGDHAISLSMTYADYQKFEQPTLGDFAE